MLSLEISSMCGVCQQLYSNLLLCPLKHLVCFDCRCWMLARRGRKKCSMDPRSPSPPMALLPASCQPLTPPAPTCRPCKCLTTGSARGEAGSMPPEHHQWGQNSDCVQKGFFGSVRRISPHRLLLYLHTAVLTSDHN